MFYSLLRPILFVLPPETAHKVTLINLNVLYKLGLTKLFFRNIPYAPCTIMGLDFPNPVGLAAGMDKDGEYIGSLASLGFGFIEVGTVTPRPQTGNPYPRLFRLPKKQAIINRMGFNNKGVDNLVTNIQKAHFKGILGVNIGKNADTPLENAVDDYLFCLHKVYPHADYVAINISSPNTPDLRKLQQEGELDKLLSALKQAQQQLTEQHDKYVPIVLKIAPDVTTSDLDKIMDKLLAYSIDGVISTNTTTSRKGLKNVAHADEAGGLSGTPLSDSATFIIKQLHAKLQGKIPIIAAGGVMSALDAQEKRLAGANLIQIYTGLIYRGPRLIKEIINIF
ncbi:quinone-dependent dihydroorotate dehydrogenase [Candidatus Halobeggiatoa sp. HSG11]|nr:quinone-dependent dihydroorotate dehydrogenase [Candidatus Halobeggiatoa sp. HSG11]